MCWSTDLRAQFNSLIVGPELLQDMEQIVQMNGFLHVKGMRLFLSLGVPSPQELVLHFEGLVRVLATPLGSIHIDFWLCSTTFLS